MPSDPLPAPGQAPLRLAPPHCAPLATPTYPSVGPPPRLSTPAIDGRQPYPPPGPGRPRSEAGREISQAADSLTRPSVAGERGMPPRGATPQPPPRRDLAGQPLPARPGSCRTSRAPVSCRRVEHLPWTGAAPSPPRARRCLHPGARRHAQRRRPARRSGSRPAQGPRRQRHRILHNRVVAALQRAAPVDSRSSLAGTFFFFFSS